MTDDAIDPRVRGPLLRYRIMAIVTGSFLLLVTLGVILKYPVGWDSETFLTVNTTIDIIHGWIYMIYLAATVHLWMRMKWGLGRLVVMALGGVVPLLSFFLEHRYAIEVRRTATGTLST